MKIITTAASALAAALPLAAAIPHSPNVLIIMTDEHNFRTLGCYRETLPPEQALMWGKTALDTPNIDRIAKTGALCERFYTNSPVCTPSRAAFITGLYPQNTGAIVNNLPLNDSCVTFAQVLKNNGYSTGYIGKWHLESGEIPGWTPKRKFGFDDNLYMWNRGHWKKLHDTPNGPEVAALNTNPKTKGAKKYSYDLNNADETSFTTDFLTTKTIDFINKNKNTGKPFCMMLSIPDPHGPDRVRTPYSEMFKNTKWELARTYNLPRDETPAWAKPTPDASTRHDQYYGMIKCIDDNIGRLLDTLAKNDLLKNTIIIFTSDHGDMRGEHHRENKSVPFEASNKVPFLITYPGKIPPGTRVAPCLSSVDFKPTLLALLGITDTAKTEGRDMSPLFLAPPPAPATAPKDIVFTRCSDWTAAITSRYKLIINSDTIWLTDLVNDPDEMKNRAYDPAYAPTMKDLAASLLDYMKTHADPHLSETPLGVHFLREAIAGTLRRLTPSELQAAQKQYPTKRRPASKNDED